MKLEDCYQLGYIIKPHGLKGEVQILLDVDNPQEYSLMESVFVLQGQKLVPFFLESISLNQDKAIVKFEEVDDLAVAKELKGKELYMPLDDLPELESDQFYFHEVQGFELIDSAFGSIGVVNNVINGGLQMLISVAHSSGKEILIPLNEDLIVSFDREAAKLVMNIPDGLVDIYLNE